LIVIVLLILVLTAGSERGHVEASALTARAEPTTAPRVPAPRNPDLAAHRILRDAVERLDPQMLLDPP
jgi:hypothetical protein